MKHYSPLTALDKCQWLALVDLVGPVDALGIWELYCDSFPLQDRRIYLGTALMLGRGAFPDLFGRGWTVQEDARNADPIHNMLLDGALQELGPADREPAMPLDLERDGYGNDDGERAPYYLDIPHADDDWGPRW
jgi:hypothetical protein